MLWVIEYLGGGILTILFATTRAWSDAATVDKNAAAVRRRIRLVAGSLAVGLVLGYFLNGGFPDVLSAFPDPASKPWVDFVGIPLLLIVLALCLARLRRRFVD